MKNFRRDLYYMPWKGSNDEDNVICSQNGSYNMTDDETVTGNRAERPRILIDNILNQNTRMRG